MNLSSPLVYTLLAIFFSAVAAFFWAWSATVKIPTGYDVGIEQAAAFALSAKRNSWGAAFAAGTAVCLALAEFVRVAPCCVSVLQN